jgi:hypothetical protein
MSDDGRRQYYGHGPDEVRRRMEEPPQRKGLFAGNRSLLIIFIDVMIILVIYAIYTFFLAGPTSTRTREDYRFSLSATRIDSSALVTLRVSAREGAAAEDPVFAVRFLESGADDAVAREVKDVLPEPQGPERVFQQEVAAPEDVQTVSVEIDALGETFTLEAATGD